MTAPAFLLHHLVRRAAEHTPDAPAVVHPKRELSYAQLWAESRKVAGRLQALGARPGELIALHFPKNPNAIVAMLGILMAGCAYVPIDPLSTTVRAATIIERCKLRILVTPTLRVVEHLHAFFEPFGEDNPLRFVVLPEPVQDELSGLTFSSWSDAAPLDTECAATEDYLAYVLHTSGSTGVPKGVAISHRNALAFVEMASELFAIQPADVLACHAPLHFDLSVFDLFCAFAKGASVVLLPAHYNAFPRKIAQAIVQYGISVWSSVVSALSLLTQRVDLSPYSLDSVRLVLFSGEVMPMTVLRKVRAAFSSAQLYNLYGQTEANSSLYFEVIELPEGDDAVLPLGRPFPNFEPFALDEQGQPIRTPGTIGELLIRAPTVASGGYYGDPERTAQVFIDDPLMAGSGRRVYRTGDHVRLDEEGRFLFCGRVDNLVKTRGYRVSLGEVELAMSAARGVNEAVVLALPDDIIGTRLVGLVTREDEALDADAVTRHVIEQLPKYMLPEPIEIRDEFPRTSTGKIDRKALRAEWLSNEAAARTAESSEP